MAGSKQAGKKRAATGQRRKRATIAEVDAAVKAAEGKPGYEMVRLLGELAKVEPPITLKRFLG